jgi:hypothetical protein
MISLSEELRNARLDIIETTVGTSPILRIRTGTMPTGTSDADVGIVLSEITLPSDWMGAASGGTKHKSGTWEDASADNTGTATHFRLYKSDGTTCVMQGSVGTSGSDMTVLSTSFVATQPFTVTAFSLSDGNG